MDNHALTQRRKKMRLENFDYGSPGAYFVTIVTYQHEKLFGVIEKEVVTLNPIGVVVQKTWLEIPEHFPETSLSAFVVMPNHLHGIIIINDNCVVGATHESPLHNNNCIRDRTRSLGIIIGLFKSTASKRIHQLNFAKQKNVWQRNYYDHIIRSDDDYQRIVDYIELNPSSWEQDTEYIPE